MIGFQKKGLYVDFGISIVRNQGKISAENHRRKYTTACEIQKTTTVFAGV